MTKVYIAARMRYRGRAREVREALEAAGHTVTSRWIDEPGTLDVPAKIATRDLHDLRAASTLVILGHCGRNGGLFVELGVALERDMRIIHIAAEQEPAEVFLAVDAVEYHRTIASAIEALGQRRAA